MFSKLLTLIAATTAAPSGSYVQTPNGPYKRAPQTKEQKRAALDKAEEKRKRKAAKRATNAQA